MTEQFEDLVFVEYEETPINPAFSNLKGITVSDIALQAFSRFFVWLEQQGIDAVAEEINLIYVDEDLEVIPNEWVVTLTDYEKIIDESKLCYKSEVKAEPDAIAQDEVEKDEMINYLTNFKQKYPLKHIDTGLVTFITIENKEALLSEVSEQDTQMLEKIAKVIAEEALSKCESATSNWGARNPNVHADMSGWAAGRAGFNSFTVDNIIRRNAAAPDDWFIVVDGRNILLEAFKPPYLPPIEGMTLAQINQLLSRVGHIPNFSHYYDPSISLGGARDSFRRHRDRMLNTRLSREERTEELAFASHFLCDMSMPYHTKFARRQILGSGGDWLYNAINDDTLANWFPELHFIYENEYVGRNWTSGIRFGNAVRNINIVLGSANPFNHSLLLVSFVHTHAATVHRYVSTNDFRSRTLECVTSWCLYEGQMALLGLMTEGRREIG